MTARKEGQAEENASSMTGHGGFFLDDLGTYTMQSATNRPSVSFVTAKEDSELNVLRCHVWRLFYEQRRSVTSKRSYFEEHGE